MRLRLSGFLMVLLLIPIGGFVRIGELLLLIPATWTIPGTRIFRKVVCNSINDLCNLCDSIGVWGDSPIKRSQE